MEREREREIEEKRRDKEFESFTPIEINFDLVLVDCTLKKIEKFKG